MPARTEPVQGRARLRAAAVAAGCDVVVEHGVVIGEVLGLEVARVVEQAGGTPRLEVGVGRHDREAFAIIHGDRPDRRGPRAAWSTPCASTAAPTRPSTRCTGSPPERWLREVVLADPAIVGAAPLEPAEGPCLGRT